MFASVDVLELPVAKTRDVNDLVNWLEKNNLHERIHPTIRIGARGNSPSLHVFGLFHVIGMALMILEEKGVLRVHSNDSKDSPNDFLILLKTVNQTTQSKSLSKANTT